MNIKNIFAKDIFRPINGVVKADQLDSASVWQELDEFVVTREMDKHLRRFISTYTESIQNPNDPNVAGNIGVWVSGFFGSGKSHFIKVLSYLLRNQEHVLGSQKKQAVDFLADKIKDPMLLGDIKKAVASNADVILFNVDSKADHKKGRDALLAVFLKVLNEMQGYSGDHPHIAHMERYLDEKGTLDSFHKAFQKISGTEWVKERDAYQFNRDEVISAFMEATGQSQASAEKWIDSAEDHFSLTVENFCKWTKEYLDKKGKNHRLLFFVDEVGQFIGSDSHLMLNLQSITELLGVVCGGRAWIIVTSQEEIDKVLGEMKTQSGNDFSKITGRFKTRLSLSSANVDEVIHSRLLLKTDLAIKELKPIYETKGDIIKNQLSFGKVGMTFHSFQNADDFARNYPFAPYQFQLVQKVFEAIRKAGATGLHLARGERSMLDGFQSAAQQVATENIGVLVPLYRFYPSIESFLDTNIKMAIDQAKDNPSLEQPFDIHILEVLFLIRYVEEVKGNVDNLVTLFVDRIDADRLALRRQIEAGLQRLEGQTLISRSGDNYFFLTNEERDIDREIKNVDLTSGEDAKLMGEIIFDDVFRGQRKYRYPVNNMDFPFNRKCDQFPVGNQSENGLTVSIITPIDIDEYSQFKDEKCVLESTNEGGHVLIRLPNDATLIREINQYLRTDKFIRTRNDGAQPETTKKILRNRADDNRERRTRLVEAFSNLLLKADYFVAGQNYSPKASAPSLALDEAMGYLVKNTFTRMSFIKHICEKPLEEIQAVLRSNDIGQQTLQLQMEESNPSAIQDVRSYIDLCTRSSKQVILHDMMENRYGNRPYGWPPYEVALIVARLMVLNEISLVMDQSAVPLDKAYEVLATQNKWRKTTIIQKKSCDPKALQDARNLGKQVFSEMGPDGEDALFSFLQSKLRIWQNNLTQYKALASTGNYAGQEEIDGALTLTRKLCAEADGYKFIERFNALKNDLLDLSEDYHDLENFYEHQKPTWEKLRSAFTRFQLNQMELERDAVAGPAFKRMSEILNAISPYKMIQEAEKLIQTVEAVNSSLVKTKKADALAAIEKAAVTIGKELDAVKGDASLKQLCASPIQTLRSQVENQGSLAHIQQAVQEAQAIQDRALTEIQEWAQRNKKASMPVTVKPICAIKPAEMTSKDFLETSDDVDRYVESLRKVMEKAISENKRIQIR